MTYLAPQPKTVSPDWSWAGEQGCFWFWLFAQHLCGSQDSWALNKCFGWCFPFYANSSNGQCTSMGGFHITWQLWGKSTPSCFRTQDIFIAIAGRVAILEIMKYAASHFSKSHFAVTPCNPCNAWAVKSAVTLCCCETGSQEKLPRVLFSVCFPLSTRTKARLRLKLAKLFSSNMNAILVNILNESFLPDKSCLWSRCHCHKLLVSWSPYIHTLYHWNHCRAQVRNH